MKTDMPLDYALFQLDSTRTRCELWISAAGVTEKLASGLLKPFLTHLRAAQEQIASGAQSIRLQAPSVTADGRNSGASWFSTGTMQRFVRFVSTPEVLARVSAVEAECQRLDEAISILARESVPTVDSDHHMLKSPSGSPPTGSKALDGVYVDKPGETKRLKQDYSDGTDRAGDASKRQLLRAMDGWRVMLQKEQRKALAQAVSAGFNMECMSDLVVFADCFGAVQLREACSKFMALRKKIQEYESLLDEMELAAEAVSASLNNSRSEIILVGTENSMESMNPKHLDTHSYNSGEFDSTLSEFRILPSDNLDLNSCPKNLSTMSKVGVSEPFHKQPGGSELQANSRSLVRKLSMESSKTSNQLDISETKEVRVTDAKVVMEKIRFLPNQHPQKTFSCKDHMSSDTACDSFSSSLPTRRIPPQRIFDFPGSDTIEKVPTFERRTLSSPNHPALRRSDQSSSPLKRSASPFKGIIHYGHSPARQKGLLVVKNVNYASSNSEDFSSMKNGSGYESEDCETSDSDWDSFEKRLHAKSKQKRLSVQDVIHLFEKRRKESGEIPMDNITKHDNSQESEETERPTDSEKGFTRRIGFSGLNSGVSSQESKGDGSIDNIYIEAPRKKLTLRKQEDGKNNVRTSSGSESARASRIKHVLSGANADHQAQKQGSLHSKLRTQNMILPVESASARLSRLQKVRMMPSSAPVPVVPEHERHNRRRSLPASTAFASTRKSVDKKMEQRKNLASESSAVLGGRPLTQTAVNTVAPSLAEIRTDEMPKHAEAAVAENAFLIDRQEEVTKRLHPQEESATTQTEQSRPVAAISQSSLAFSGLTIPSRLPHRKLLFANGQAISSVANDWSLNPLKDTGSVCKSWSSSSDFQLEKIAAKSKDFGEEEHAPNSSIGIQHDLIESFYEQYRQKRDAKLRQESGSKRAEREAKMKAMHEIFERRKAEFSSRSFKLIETRMVAEDLGSSEKLEFIKVGLSKSGKDKEERERSMDNHSLPWISTGGHQNSSTPKEVLSTCSTPRLERLQMNTSKLKQTPKASSGPQKYLSSIATPRIISRSIAAPASKPVSNNSNVIAIPASQLRGSSGAPAKAISKSISRSRSSSLLDLGKDTAKTTNSRSGPSLLEDKPISPQIYHAPHHIPVNEVLGYNLKGVVRKNDSLEQASNNLGCAKLQEVPTTKNICTPGVLKQPLGFSSEKPVLTPLDISYLSPLTVAPKTSQHSSSCPGEDDMLGRSDFKEISVSDKIKGNDNEYFSSFSSTVQLVEAPDSEGPEMFCSMELEEMPPTVSSDNLRATDMDASEPDRSQRSSEATQAIDTFVSVAENYYSSSTAYVDPSAAGKDIQEVHEEVSSDNFLPSSVFLELDVSVSRFYIDEVETNKLRRHSDLATQESTLAHSSASISEYSQTHRAVKNVGIDSSAVNASQLVHTISMKSLNSSMSTGSSCVSPKSSAHDINQVQGSRSPDAHKVIQAQNFLKSFSTNRQPAQKEFPRGFKRLLKFGRKSRTSEQTSQEWSIVDDSVDESRDYSALYDARSTSKMSSNSYPKADKVAKFADPDCASAGPRSFFSLSSFRSRSSESKSKP
ncbi:hypothetical protein O6H91_14G006200 [Diphasiastrum complanatum]|uniref:Uncharacterized protein n=1 Tax=Diphasiastrum complanatum TaxID=34168 RepID=A0ACC2BL44_DIPCM|nr:hypothetical protein O6H91_14G006200 [Diphasiastrum complanatum]